MARLKPTIGWAISGRAGAHDVALDSRLPALVAAAARLVGEPLLVLSRGKGAALAPLGERLLAAHRAATARVSQDPLSVPLHPAANRRVRAATLKVAASHDIALAQLRDRWRLVNGVALDFLGSGASLSAYASGAAEVAGFHVAPLPRGGLDPLLARLDPARDALIRFLRREQGLIVARGNPRRVKGVADIATKRLTFVNRQPGSGTRLLLDRLLARKRIDAASIAGYTSEEFTHAAVAATIAAGRADVGFGLAFVPLVREHYLFACRRRQVESPRIVAFRALLASDATRAVVAPLPGYALDAPGAVVEKVGSDSIFPASVTR